MPTLVDTVGQQPAVYVYGPLREERQGYLSIYSYTVEGIPHRFELIERGDAAVILPVDFEKRELYYIVQPRYLRVFAENKAGRAAFDYAKRQTFSGEGRYENHKNLVLTHEIPAGMIEPNEDAHIAAMRELKEETGFEISEYDLEPLPPVYASSGVLTERLHLFIASVSEQTPRQKPKGDGSEQITIWKASWDEAFAMLDQGVFKSASCGLLMRELRYRAKIRA